LRVFMTFFYWQYLLKHVVPLYNSVVNFIQIDQIIEMKVKIVVMHLHTCTSMI
jgi:hypothetical protein